MRKLVILLTVAGSLVAAPIWAQVEGLNMGLGTLPIITDAKTRSISAENPNGEPGGGARAWAFGDTYSTAFLGYPFCRKEPGEIPKHSLYRWHIMDPIRFQKDLKVTIQALGHWLPIHKFQPLTDDIASVAYWYQKEPHAPFPVMLPVEARWPR